MTQWHADEINAYAMEQAVFEGLARRGAIRVKGEIVLTTPAVLQAAWVEARMRAQRPTGQVEVPANLE